MASDHTLTLLTLLPAAAAGLVALAPTARVARWSTLFVTTVVAALVWSLTAAPVSAGLTHCVSAPWVPSLGAAWLLGVDGVSLPLVVLTGTLFLLATLASWPIERDAPRYFALLLALETGVLGVFVALDFVLFYVFWELTLVPMYFLIAVWGGERAREAALRFFLFTFSASVLMLAAGLLLYGASDLTRLSAADLARCGVLGAGGAKSADAAPSAGDWLASGDPLAERFARAEADGTPLRTFNLLALQRLAAETDAFTARRWLGRELAWWAFVLLLLAMLVKLPAAPLHTWLPAAHVEAPTPVSMLLAGVLLKMGGYGLVRVAWPVCPGAAAELAWLVGVVGVVSMWWGALAALAQDDFKRLVAYSSVSHMGYVLLGLAAGAAGGDAWSLGAPGAVFQMVAHGVTSAGMFFAVGLIYERVHHRDLAQLGGLMNRMPLSSGLALVLAMASLGLPGLCGFVGEVLVLLPAWGLSPTLAVAAAAVAVVTAAYTLRAVRLAYYGAEYRGPLGDRLIGTTPREAFVLVTLAVAAVVLGVRPGLVTERTELPLAAVAPRGASLPEPTAGALAPGRADAPLARRTTR